MGSKSKLQKFIEKEEKEIEDAEMVLDARREAVRSMKKIENGDTETEKSDE